MNDTPVWRRAAGKRDASAAVQTPASVRRMGLPWLARRLPCWYVAAVCAVTHPNKDHPMTTASRTMRSSTNGHEFSEKIVELRALLADIAKSAPAAASETFEDLKAKATALCDSCEGGVNRVTH